MYVVGPAAAAVSIGDVHVAGGGYFVIGADASVAAHAALCSRPGAPCR